MYIYTLEYVADGTRVEQVRNDGYVLAWTHQVLFVRFSYVGDAAPSLNPSIYVSPIPLLFYYFGDLSPFFSKRQPETSETYVQLVTCIEMLNRHSDDNSSRTMPIKAFLYLMYLSRRFPLILSSLHLSSLAH